MLTLEVWSFCIHYLIHIWITCWWILKKIVSSKLQKFDLFDKKRDFLKPFWQKLDAVLEVLFCSWNSYLMLNYWFANHVFQCFKIMVVRQVQLDLKLHQTWQIRLVSKTQSVALRNKRTDIMTTTYLQKCITFKSLM